MQSRDKSYSGPYFWLATVSFIVPLVVAGQAFQNLPESPTYPEITPDASGVDQLLWDHLLRNYVADGLVDYDGLKRNHQFKVYLRQLAQADPDKLSGDNEKLAFYCNAYNAFVINGVLIHKVKQNVLVDVTNAEGSDNVFFDLGEHILAGETISLNHLEHEVIRPTFGEPRIHMALVCAARSCPAIRPEAYIGDQIDTQLEDQAKQFANNPAHVRYDAQEQQLHLSSILTWYGDDFGGNDGVLKFLLSRVDDPATRAGIEAAQSGSATVSFNEYDWTLNTQSTITGGGGQSKNFGSGSIPNE